MNSTTQPSLRIGILTYGLDRRPTGIGRYTFELLRAFAKLSTRPEIVLLTTERDRSAIAGLGFETHALPGSRRLPALLTYGNLTLSFAARRYRLNLVHDPNGIAPFLGPSDSTRRVVTIHDACARVYPEEHSRLDAWRYRALLPHAARRADRILTDSIHSQKDLEAYLGVSPMKSLVIPCGVDARFHPISASRERSAVLERHRLRPPYLLYVGALNGRKNLGRLLAAFTQIRTRHPELALVIAGGRQWQAMNLGTTLTRLDLQNHVHLLGYVDDADLPALYSGAAAFVFPSLYEGFGLPVLEAMACGTPAIASRTSSIPEVASDAAILVDPLDVSAIAEGIERVLRCSDLAADLRARGLARARELTWDRAARETLDVYIKLLDGENAL